MTSNFALLAKMPWLRVMLGSSLFCLTPFAVWNIAQFIEGSGLESTAVFGIGTFIGTIGLSVFHIAIRLVIPVDLGNYRYKFYRSPGRDEK